MEGGRGGGKSLALLWEAIYQCVIVEKCNCLLLRRTLSAAEKGGIEDHFIKYIPRKLYKNWNGSKHCATFHNGSQLFFGYIEGDQDLGQYQSAEFLFIGFDEITQFTYSQWDYMKGSNRCPVKFDCYGKPTQPRMAGATNPNGKGSGWVKALWITHKPPAGEMMLNYRAEDYESIHSTYEDNSVYANDKDYIEGLTSISDTALREAWIPGNWDILAGQYFQQWDEKRHVKSFSEIEFEDWQERWIGIDWGYTHACAVGWFTRAKIANPISPELPKRDVIVCYRELIVRKTNEEVLGERIAHHTGTERINRVFLSPERFNRTNEEHTLADRLGDKLREYNIPRPERANNDRVGGWTCVGTLLDTETLIVLNSCQDVIQSIPRLQRDPKHLEDAIKEGNELHLDVCEMVRYACMSYANSVPIPREIAEDRYIKSLVSNQHKYLEHLRLSARKPIADIALNVPMAPGMGRRH